MTHNLINLNRQLVSDHYTAGGESQQHGRSRSFGSCRNSQCRVRKGLTTTRLALRRTPHSLLARIGLRVQLLLSETQGRGRLVHGPIAVLFPFRVSCRGISKRAHVAHLLTNTISARRCAASAAASAAGKSPAAAASAAASTTAVSPCACLALPNPVLHRTAPSVNACFVKDRLRRNKRTGGDHMPDH